jgi:soluble lytic murein transglycosylase-like protein
MTNGHNSELNQDYLKMRRPFIIVCLLVIGLALLQYIWNSDSPSTPATIKRYSKTLASSLVKHLPSRFLISGRLSSYSSYLGAQAHWKKHYRPKLREIAPRYGLDPHLVEILISVESGFRADAISSRGAVGLMQVLPTTALDMNIANPFDPVENLHAGCRYLSRLLRTYKGDLSLALAAYNAGPGAVDRYGGIPPFPETQDYVKKILKRYRAEKPAHTR